MKTNKFIIDIRQCTDEVFGGKDVHDISFTRCGYTRVITLTTKELRRLQRKIKKYLETETYI